jgi:hypothetical protein
VVASVSDAIQTTTLLATFIVVIISIIARHVALRIYPGTALLKLKIGERYKIKALLEKELSVGEKKISFWLMLLEDHEGNVGYYKMDKDKLPHISEEYVGKKIVQTTDDEIYLLSDTNTESVH